MARREYAGAAVVTTITGSIASTGGGTVTIDSTTGWPDGGTGKFSVIVDPTNSSAEKILITDRTGTTLTYDAGDRGYDGTSETAHSSGATIWVCVTAVDLDEANEHVNDTAGAHAATAISFSPTGNIAATTVQAAIAEVDSETDSRLDTHDTTLTSLSSTATTHGGRLDAIEANEWVTTARIDDDAVTAAKIADGVITADHLDSAQTVFATLSSATVSGAGAIETIGWTTATTDPHGYLGALPDTTLSVPSGQDGLCAIELIATPDAIATLHLRLEVGNRTIHGATRTNTTSPTSLTWMGRLSVGNTIRSFIVNEGVTRTYTATITVNRLSPLT